MKKEPLRIYVLWHKNFDDGYEYEKNVVIDFSKNVNDPFGQNVGIPIYSCNETSMFKVDEILEIAQQIAFLIFVDKNMVADENWQNSIEYLISKCALSTGKMIFPVEIDDTSFKLSDKLSSKNFICLKDIKSEEYRQRKLIYMFAHELCRMLYNLDRIAEVTETEGNHAPIKLFLSHAKKDGQTLAREINTFIHTNTPLKTFFDSNDIATGYDFSDEIIANIKTSVVLVLHTDSYSSRDWCQREILAAKKNKRPIIVVDILEKGENRSFPYLSNIRVIRVSPNMHSEILTGVLLETLRLKYQVEYLKYLKEVYDISVEIDDIFFYPPELLTLLYLEKENPKVIVYPDPPLNDNELDILHKFRPETQFVTPLMLPSLVQGTRLLDSLGGKEICISISEPTKTTKNGFEINHLNIAASEMAKYLLACDAKLGYCGNINYNDRFNYLMLLYNVVHNYHYNKDAPKKKITNYYSKSYPISVEQRALFKDSIIFFDATSMLNINPDTQIGKAINLSSTRNTAIGNAKACIFMGGKEENFQGIYPGIIEEAYLALKKKKSVYLLGAFGGATRCIIECVFGKRPFEMTREFHFQNDRYKEFYYQYNDFAKKNGLESIDYEYIIRCFNETDISDLNNGLSIEENNKLFYTDNISEVVALILKGLSQL